METQSIVEEKPPDAPLCWRYYPRPPRLPVLTFFWPICLPLGSPMCLSIGSCGVGLR